jgi:hypothetical protein
MTSKAVVALRQGKAIAEPRPQLPKAVVAGLTDLTIAFPTARQQADGDRQRWLQLAATAVSSFDPRLVENVLRWLVLNNKRNPFPPTPQDLHEACRTREGEWRVASLAKYELCSAYPREVVVPADLEAAFVREWIDVALRHRYRESLDRLLAMPDLTFSRIPADAFSDGARDHIITLRNERTDRERCSRERCISRTPVESLFLPPGSEAV